MVLLVQHGVAICDSEGLVFRYPVVRIPVIFFRFLGTEKQVFQYPGLDSMQVSLLL